ncbi:fimbrial protein [Pantoea sp. 1.19]|uniref:fimbrial protein n=1 Tax=Pantoea sp. 1.19 TaxID=1925589 RepID=UPI000948B244|nr:fimbrial protein [Pantoea sp. 1.19]
MKICIRRSMLLASLLLSGAAFAQPHGVLEPIAGTFDYNIDLNNTDITNNTAGATISRAYDLSGTYTAQVWCNTNITNAPIYFSSTATLMPDSQRAGYLKLNDYLSVKIEIWVSGAVQAYFPVPFNDISNRLNNRCIAPSSRITPDLGSGSRGRVTFMVTKPIINGIRLEGTEIAKLYGSLVPGNRGSVALSRTNINSAIITVPDKCIINQGTPITVDFGNIPGSGSKLNGVNFSKNIPIHVKCQGGSFASGALNIKLGIQQASPAFEDGRYLSVSGVPARPELGIALKDSSGQPVIPNQFYRVPGFTQNEGNWNLVAAPIAKSASSVIQEGAFSASAAVVAEFQ